MDLAGPKKGPSRRAVVAAPGGAGLAALLAACAGDGDPSPAAPPATGGAPASPAATAATPGAGGTGASLAKVSDIPVGGGRIFSDREIVVTQPRAGTIKAFSAVCTHQGCTVASVGATIDCPCHGSKFDIADGSVVSGPASRALPPVAVRVSGDTITLR